MLIYRCLSSQLLHRPGDQRQPRLHHRRLPSRRRRGHRHAVRLQMYVSCCVPPPPPPLHSRHELTPCSQPPSASSSPSTPTPGSPSPATSALLAPWPASRAPSCLAGSPSMSGASASGTQRGSGGSFGGWRTGMRIARLASKRKKGVYVERSTSMTKGREAKTKTKKRWKKAVCRWEADTNPMWRRMCAWL